MGPWMSTVVLSWWCYTGSGSSEALDLQSTSSQVSSSGLVTTILEIGCLDSMLWCYWNNVKRMENLQNHQTNNSMLPLQGTLNLDIDEQMFPCGVNNYWLGRDVAMTCIFCFTLPFIYGWLVFTINCTALSFSDLHLTVIFFYFAIFNYIHVNIEL